MRDFREIKVWAKAHLLTLEIYKVTATFPREEIYGLTTSCEVRPLQSRQTALRDLGEMETQSSHEFFRSEWDLRARSSIISF